MRLFALCICLLFLGCSKPYQANRVFDINYLLQMPELSGEAVQLKENYTLVLYFQEVDCNTCIDRDLLNIKSFFGTYKPKVNPLIIAQDRLFFERGTSPNLVQLKRVGRLKAPILVEEVPGSAGFGQHMTIALIDHQEKRILLEYHPVVDRDHWPSFEKALRRTLQI